MNGIEVLKNKKRITMLDSSKLRDFLTCPRYYFFRHLLGWSSERERKNNHLIFGEAWHRLMEQLLINGNNSTGLEKGIAAFQAYWEEEYKDEDAVALEEALYPKSLNGAIEAAVKYVEHYQHERIEVLEINGEPMTEIFGTAPINLEKNRSISFRLDALVTYIPYNQTAFVDHKTASRESETWREQWQLSMQMSIYTHVLHMLEPDSSRIYGGIVNGVAFRKKGPAFMRVPVKKTLADMSAWLWEINDLIDRLEEEEEKLSEVKEESVVMTAFARNPESCTKYNRTCPYHDFCVSWQNPLRYADTPPTGMIVDFWNPNREAENAKFILSESGELKKKVEEKKGGE